jgi:hypothetical protein
VVRRCPRAIVDREIFMVRSFVVSHFHSSITMFVYLKGHHLLEYYFSVPDARLAANDGMP